ncbi:LCP family protein [Patescibacteria group bacterium]|nr:LCP family protein [Patescibacteria group bacterium]
MRYTDAKNLKLNNHKKRPGNTKLIAVFTFAILSAAVLFIFRDRIKTAFNPISIIGKVVAAELHTTDGRTNILLLGSDMRKEGAEINKPTLTDTILVASIGSLDKDVVLISVPRDLWIKWKTDNGEETFSKINAVYDYTTYHGEKIGGIDNLIQVINETLDIPIHYYGVVTFNVFKEFVDIVDGIDIDVEKSFTDYYYPVEGKENAPLEERYEVVSFEKGTQTMNGDRALKFARSRKGDNGEGSDFARSKRQQKVIMAIKDKALSIKTLINPIKLKELYDTYSDNVDTNIDFGVIQSFYLLSQQIDFDKVVSVVLDDRSQAIEGGLLYAPEDTTLYGDQYVLIPQTGDFSQIHAYVKKYLFGDK